MKVDPQEWIESVEQNARTAIAREQCKPRPNKRELDKWLARADMIAHVHSLIIADESKRLAKEHGSEAVKNWQAESPCRKCPIQETCGKMCPEFTEWVHSSWTMARKVFLKDGP